MAQIEIRNVTRRFGDPVAVDNVSLNIEAGEFITLLASRFEPDVLKGKV